MSGRRSHPRVAVSPAAQGSLRLLRELLVQQVEEGEVVAISRQPGTIGEVLEFELSRGSEMDRLECHVIASAPLIVDGTLKYCLRLKAVADRTDRILQLVPPATERQ